MKELIINKNHRFTGITKYNIQNPIRSLKKKYNIYAHIEGCKVTNIIIDYQKKEGFYRFILKRWHSYESIYNTKKKNIESVLANNSTNVSF